MKLSAGSSADEYNRFDAFLLSALQFLFLCMALDDRF